MFLSKKGLSLIEIMVALIVISLMISPIYNLFFIGSQLNKEGKQLYFVNVLCSNYLNAIINVDRLKVIEIDDMEDKEISGSLSLENIGMEPCYEGYKRKLTIESLEDTNLFSVKVSVFWKSKKKAKLKSYTLKTLVEKNET
ncbi:MAG: hypothetical protein COB02_13365 [Candidatus Cloacimonadota bacterium]|nr:MAG: hypothetical protein COB02_13365 [Candidatus Cloacimonadota bacterium]